MELVDEQEDTIEVDPEVVEVLETSASPARLRRDASNQSKACRVQQRTASGCPARAASRPRSGLLGQDRETVSVQGRKITTDWSCRNPGRRSPRSSTPTPAESAQAPPPPTITQGYHQL